MFRHIVTLVFLSAAAHAATFNVTLNVNANATLGADGNVHGSGTATLSGLGTGAFTSTLSLTTFSGPYTISFPGSTITGTLTTSLNVLSGAGGASMTVTGGSGAYTSATGSFPNLAGNGAANSAGTGIILTFNGSGTINTLASPPPAIVDVLDAASNTEGVAQGGIFIVKGSNLCPQEFAYFSVPRPTSAPDGVRITFTPVNGGVSTDAIIWYEYNQNGVNQLAAIVPSTLATGNYNLTVTNGSVSSPFPVAVSARKFELFTQDSTGSGLAAVQNFISSSRVDLNSYTTGSGKSTTISPAHPGQYVIAYGTGMGALAGGDNAAAPAYDFSANGVSVKAIVGGVSIPVLYAGRAGYAGEDQIDFQLPANVPTGCTVPLQISVNGTLSATTYLAIAPDANSTSCVQAGFSNAQLSSFDQGNYWVVGTFQLIQLQATSADGTQTASTNNATGTFLKYSGAQLFALTQANMAANPTGQCSVTHSVSANGNTLSLSGGGFGVDAGNITLNGPSGSGITNLPFVEDPASHFYMLTMATVNPGSANVGTGVLATGQYTISGSGGTDIGKFTATATVGAPLTLSTALPATINRNSPLTINWTGGGANDVVNIVGYSSAAAGGVSDNWGFTCSTTAGAKTFTVPVSVLSQLPASSTGGFIEVLTAGAGSTFTAPLTAGGSINAGVVLPLVGPAVLAAYQ